MIWCNFLQYLYHTHSRYIYLIFKHHLNYEKSNILEKCIKEKKDRQKEKGKE